MRRIQSLGLATLLLLALEVRADEPIRVFVSILPQAKLVERIGGERVEVSALVQPGQSPATYEPTPKQLAELSKARLYLRIGVPCEHGFIEKIRETYPELRIVDQRKGVKMLQTSVHVYDHVHDHVHDHDHDHVRGEVDPHIWLDPRRLLVQTRNIAAALVAIDGEHVDTYRTNLERLHADIDALDGHIREVLAPFRGRTLLVYHPAYSYFADSYELKQLAVEIEGKQPGAKQLAGLIDRARELEAKVIFVQPQFSKKSAELVAQAIGGAVVFMDPLDRDVLKNLENMASQVKEAFQEKER